MAPEIERKFLIDLNKLNLTDQEERNTVIIDQHYLPSAPNQTIRIRKYDEGRCGSWHEMCIKFIISDMERDEIEFEIDSVYAEELICHSIGFVRKKRLTIKRDNIEWDVDIYLKPEGIAAVAEVELDFVEQEVGLPDWIIKEVTHEPGYSNYELATKEKQNG
jgi:CYTH domain-containing protein